MSHHWHLSQLSGGNKSIEQVSEGVVKNSLRLKKSLITPSIPLFNSLHFHITSLTAFSMALIFFFIQAHRKKGGHLTNLAPTRRELWSFSRSLKWSLWDSFPRNRCVVSSSPATIQNFSLVSRDPERSRTSLKLGQHKRLGLLLTNLNLITTARKMLIA